ncbi:hypothetical protein I6A84_38610 [Frankia sp. CNm7]|uniref:SnoaL-like domain-containing protein n=1 Tax=Frankia nepalensis TaxID=1836974 RepID=A0A937RKB2_9ACTN|nr:hypothetical protein [Frankia nepalensis]MBL7496518.1 hypothetical protein [Frankia nepalensis]MBL7508737.1 hypothetical protein [Frankia nepalensis]MBL7523800.1 hypothetical protein [Frankia nepalensis]MBL7627491.1 hypothetical protein [Frankia nepalensis]
MALALRDLDEVIDDYTGLSRVALDYTQLMKKLVDGGKQPGFSVDSWAPVAELVAVDSFERIGPFKEVMAWPEYAAFLTQWARTSDWECSFRRVTEAGPLVLLELEERSTVGGHSGAVNSATTYEFDAGGKITRLAVYLQMQLPDPEMLRSYEGIQITE